MKLDLEAIKARCEALDDRMGKKPWTLERSSGYPGLFSVYDGDGNVVSYGVEEEQAVIAHARTDIPMLLAEVERLQTESVLNAKMLASQCDLARDAENERDEWWAEVKRLQRELHDAQVRRDEWEKMYSQALLVHGGDEEE